MPTNVIMPQLGESVVEGTLSKWLKKEGDAVAEYEPLMEVNTDKVDTEVPAPASGILLRCLVPEGTTVKAGTVLAIIGQANEGISAEASTPSSSPSAALAPTPAAPPMQRRDLGFISPVVAKLADEHKVDLQLVTGTGLGGRITKKDVLDYVAGNKPAHPEPPTVTPPVSPPLQSPILQSSPSESFIPVVGMRKLIAEHMVLSERTAPHVTTVMEADMTRVLAHLDANKDAFTRDGVTLTLTAYFVSAAVAALKAVPLVNSQWAEDKILLKREVNIGMAVALDEGLIVPVIKHADTKSLLGLAREINDLAKRARAKGLKPEEVQGGTFTITNHGVSGSLLATPIINQPQTGILGVGIVQKRVIVINDAIAIRPMVYLTLTFDHRILDGASGDKCLMTVKKTLEGWP
jgi:2-oxoglutarate dehydrogenase E2 component (dihydrolipoamide succinyltransferase)